MAKDAPHIEELKRNLELLGIERSRIRRKELKSPKDRQRIFELNVLIDEGRERIRSYLQSLGTST